MAHKKLTILTEADEFMESFGESAYQEARYEFHRAIEREEYERAAILLSICSEIKSRSNFDPELTKH